MENVLLGKELIISEHGSLMWSKNEQYMKCFIISMENYLNDYLVLKGYLSPETIIEQLCALPVGILDTVSWLESIRFIRYDSTKVLKINIDRVTDDHSYILVITYDKKGGAMIE